MRRRRFLGSLVAGATAVAGSSKLRTSGETPPADFQGADTAGQVESGSPRIRRIFNRDWLFKRQTNGAGCLGSMDRQNGRAALIEPEFRKGHNPDYDD